MAYGFFYFSEGLYRFVALRSLTNLLALFTDCIERNLFKKLVIEYLRISVNFDNQESENY